MSGNELMNERLDKIALEKRVAHLVGENEMLKQRLFNRDLEISQLKRKIIDLKSTK